MLSDYGKLQKVDLRVQKTERVLIASMYSLLNECRFTKLTIDKICKEGLISRATFYTHFLDKYDFLEYWLLSFWTYKATKIDTYENVKESINKFINENKKIIKNLLSDADNQTLEIIQNLLCSTFDINNAKRVDEKGIQKNIVTANLYVGGIIYYLLWQVRNNFPPDVPIINEYSFDAINNLRDWMKEQ